MADREQRASAELTPQQKSGFDETGLLHLPAAISAEQTRQMRDSLWEELARKHGIIKDAPETWKEGQVFSLQGPGRAGAFAGMASDTVRRALDVLFAPDGWRSPARWGAPLVTFPFGQREWKVPNAIWHLDIYGEIGVRRSFGEVTVFAFLDRVLSEGGATVAVAGSHRLVLEFAVSRKTRVKSEDARRFLANCDPWLKELWSDDTAIARRQRLMNDGAVVRGVALRVVEITGEPGDVVVMHSSILHAPAPNCRDVPRMVLRQGIYRAQPST